MDFVQSLLQKVQEATGQSDTPWRGINPLVVIGLTESILELALTEEQLWNTVRSYGRQLAAQVHPDRRPTNVSPERQVEILEAFDVLNNRQTFSKALSHFKNLRAEDRKEVKLMSQTVSALRRQIAEFDLKHKSFSEQKRQLEIDRGDFERQKLNEPLVVPDLEKKIRYFQGQVKKLESVHSNTSKVSAKWKRQFETLAEYLVELGGKLKDKYPGALLACDARWIVFASTWPCDLEKPSPYNNAGKPLRNFSRALRAMGIKKEQEKRILERWDEVNVNVGTPTSMEFNRLPVGLSVVGLNVGDSAFVYGNTRAVPRGRVIGCVPPDKIPVTHSSVVYRISQEVIFENLVPYIVPGGVLVSIVKEKGTNKASWSLKCPSFSFHTRRVIVEVGV